MKEGGRGRLEGEVGKEVVSVREDGRLNNGKIVRVYVRYTKKAPEGIKPNTSRQ